MNLFQFRDYLPASGRAVRRLVLSPGRLRGNVNNSGKWNVNDFSDNLAIASFRAKVEMDVPMKYEGSTSAHPQDMNPMRNSTENRQKNLQTAKPSPSFAGEFSDLNPDEATSASDEPKAERGKSTFAYIFIAAGLLACLVWSSTLFWLLMKALMLLGA